jgi:N-acetylglucosamine-6-sulfatase
LQDDPNETTNLIRSAAHQAIAKQMSRELFDELKRSNGMYIPLYKDEGEQSNLRYEFGSPAAEFPSFLKREGDQKQNHH